MEKAKLALDLVTGLRVEEAVRMSCGSLALRSRS
jgi:hypothetical protein